MKKIFLPVVVLMLTSISLAQTKNDKSCGNAIAVNGHYRKADSLHAIMKRYTEAGLPGVPWRFIRKRTAGGQGPKVMQKLKQKYPCKTVTCNIFKVFPNLTWRLPFCSYASREK